jgi:hypothetical protein
MIRLIVKVMGNKAASFIVGWLICIVVVSSLYYLFTGIYYRVAPGSWFLNFSGLTIQSGLVGEDLNGVLCRRSTIGPVKITATRTYIYEGHRPVAEYNFDATVENDGNECIPLTLPAARHPQVPGEYRIHTDVWFKAGGVDKTTSYTSTPYNLRKE